MHKDNRITEFRPTSLYTLDQFLRDYRPYKFKITSRHNIYVYYYYISHPGWQYYRKLPKDELLTFKATGAYHVGLHRPLIKDGLVKEFYIFNFPPLVFFSVAPNTKKRNNTKELNKNKTTKPIHRKQKYKRKPKKLKTKKNPI